MLKSTMGLDLFIQMLEDTKNGKNIEKYNEEFFNFIYDTDLYIAASEVIQKSEDIYLGKLLIKLRGEEVCPDIRLGYIKREVYKLEERFGFDKVASHRLRLETLNRECIDFVPYIDNIILDEPNLLKPYETSEAILLLHERRYLEHQIFKEGVEALNKKSLKGSPVLRIELSLALKEQSFEDLGKVKELSAHCKLELVKLLSINSLPYQIAMLAFLGYDAFLKEKYKIGNNKLYEIIAKILSADLRSVKGNFLVLNHITYEDKRRYTAYKYQEQVRKDYKKLI